MSECEVSFLLFHSQGRDGKDVDDDEENGNEGIQHNSTQGVKRFSLLLLQEWKESKVREESIFSLNPNRCCEK